MDAQQAIKANLDIKAGTASLIPATPSLNPLMIDLLDGPDPYVIPPGDIEKEITVKLTDAGQSPPVVLLLITSSLYDGCVRYTTDGSGGSKREWFALEFPQVFLGRGAVKVLADNPETLYFKNKATDNATVWITLGRARSQTATNLTSSENPSVSGDSVTFTATVSATSCGAGVPSGTVTFNDGSTTQGIPRPLDCSGVATYSTTSLSVGTHSITAVYGGDATNAPSTSKPVSQVVNAQAARVPTP